MGWGDAMREAMYKYIPGLGKAPEFSASKLQKEQVRERREGKEANSIESGSIVIAKRKYDTKGNPKPEHGLVSEDAVIADEQLGLFAVADGVGSGGHGEVASQLATEAVIATIRAGKYEGMPDEEREQLMRDALEEAALRIKETRETDPSVYAGMNTTFSGFLLDKTPDGRMVATIGHVGDSRVYRFNKESGLVAMTNDDNVLDVLTRYGAVPGDASRAIDQSQSGGKGVDLPFSDEVGFLQAIREAMKRASGPGQETDLARLQDLEHALNNEVEVLSKATVSLKKRSSMAEKVFKLRNNIFDAVSPNNERVHRFNVKTVDVKDGDLYFAVSDGVSDPLTEERIQQIIEEGLAAGKEPQEIFQDIAEEAKSDTSNRQKGKINIKGSDGVTVARSVFEGDDTAVSGMRASFREAREQVRPREQGAVAPEVVVQEEPVERAYDESAVETLRATVKEYEKALSDIRFAEGVKATFQGRLKDYGENLQAPELGVLHLLNTDSDQRTVIGLKYFGERDGNRRMTEKLMQAKSWAAEVMREQKFKTIEEAVAYLRKKTESIYRKIADVDVGISTFERKRDQLRPDAELAKVNILRALAEDPTRVQEGDEVTMEVFGKSVKTKVHLGKRGDVILEPLDTGVEARWVMPLEGSKGPDNIAKLKVAFAKEAEATEAALVAAQAAEAEKMAQNG